MRLLAIVALIVAGTRGAQAGSFVTYSMWKNWPVVAKAAYVSGMYDAIIHWMNRPEPGTRFERCVTGSQMTAQQLAEKIQKHADANPVLQTGVMIEAVRGYLFEACPDRKG